MNKNKKLEDLITETSYRRFIIIKNDYDEYNVCNEDRVMVESNASFSSREKAIKYIDSLTI